MNLLAEQQRFLDDNRIPLRLACLGESGWPLVVSLWYLVEAGKLYCATQASARVVAHLRQDDRCGFEIAADQPPYCGLRGRGRAVIDDDQGLAILQRLLARYLGGIDNPLAQNLLNRRSPEVAIIITPEQLTSWDFSQRMASSLAGYRYQKVCPA